MISCSCCNYTKPAPASFTGEEVAPGVYVTKMSADEVDRCLVEVEQGEHPALLDYAQLLVETVNQTLASSGSPLQIASPSAEEIERWQKMQDHKRQLEQPTLSPEEAAAWNANHVHKSERLVDLRPMSADTPSGRDVLPTVEAPSPGYARTEVRFTGADKVDQAVDLARHLLFHAERNPVAYDSIYGQDLVRKAREIVDEE